MLVKGRKIILGVVFLLLFIVDVVRGFAVVEGVVLVILAVVVTVVTVVGRDVVVAWVGVVVALLFAARSLAIASSMSLSGMRPL